MDVPDGVQWLRSHPGGSEWLDRLPLLVDACARRWSLQIGLPFAGSYVSVVFPVEGATGDPAVLKLQFPDRESEGEAAALRAWAGNGAVRLLAHDPDRRALLIERCVPGTPLGVRDPREALDVLIDLVRELTIPPPSAIVELGDEAERWATSLPQHWERVGRPFSRRLLDAALEAMRGLATTQGPPVLLHQDLHGDNVLRARRRPWLVIDPKPLAGERDFQAAPIVRSAELGSTARDAQYRLDRLCDELELDPERAMGWTVAQTLAWAFEGDRVVERHVRVAEWMIASR
jgi:streptomycin 6-kinase